MTRIVAGIAGGRTLSVPRNGTRPTSERVREALFSKLEHRGNLKDAIVLDLYAGSGALGLEAASRGASRVDLVERARLAATVIQRNARSVGLTTNIHVQAMDVERFLAQREGDAFNGDVTLVFIDPPYDVGEEALGRILEFLLPWLTPDAYVVIERSSRSPEPMWPRGLKQEGKRKYGETQVWFADHGAVTP